MSRTTCASLLAGIGLAVSLHATPSPPGGQGATELLARARQALGGDARLGSIRSFVATGSITRGYRSRLNHGSFEVAAELPDRFVSREAMTYVRLPDPGRIEEDRRQATLGFNGRRVIYEPPGTNRRTAPARFGQAEVGPLLPQAQLDFVRLTLGMFAASFAGAPLTFSDPGGVPGSHTVAVELPQGRTMLLEFDPVTHLPARFDDVQYSDYRQVDGMKVPFRITRLGSAKYVDASTLDSIRFNVEIPTRRFRAN